MWVASWRSHDHLDAAQSRVRRIPRVSGHDAYNLRTKYIDKRILVDTRERMERMESMESMESRQHRGRNGRRASQVQPRISSPFPTSAPSPPASLPTQLWQVCCGQRAAPGYVCLAPPAAQRFTHDMLQQQPSSPTSPRSRLSRRRFPGRAAKRRLSD